VTVSDARGHVTLYHGVGDGTFAAGRSAGFIAAAPTVLRAADIDGDGLLDLAIGTSNRNLELAYGRPGGRFEPVLISLALTPTAIEIGDVDGREGPDLVVVGQGPDGIEVLTNYAHHGPAGPRRFEITQDAFDLRAVDVNGDAHTDIVAIDSTISSL